MINISIVSDGTASGTKVLVGGVEAKGVTRIEIDPITPQGSVTGRISVSLVKLDLQAQPLPEKRFSMRNNNFGTTEEFGEREPPEWLTRNSRVPGIAVSYLTFWRNNVLCLDVGQSCTCYSRTITRIA